MFSERVQRSFYDGAIRHALLYVRTNVRVSNDYCTPAALHPYSAETREASSPAKTREQTHCPHRSDSPELQQNTQDGITDTDMSTATTQLLLYLLQ